MLLGLHSESTIPITGNLEHMQVIEWISFSCRYYTFWSHKRVDGKCFCIKVQERAAMIRGEECRSTRRYSGVTFELCYG